MVDSLKDRVHEQLEKTRDLLNRMPQPKPLPGGHGLLLEIDDTSPTFFFVKATDLRTGDVVEAEVSDANGDVPEEFVGRLLDIALAAYYRMPNPRNIKDDTFIAMCEIRHIFYKKAVMEDI